MELIGFDEKRRANGFERSIHYARYSDCVCMYVCVRIERERERGRERVVNIMK
jgi:hypothetical protein